MFQQCCNIALEQCTCKCCNNVATLLRSSARLNVATFKCALLRSNVPTLFQHLLMSNTRFTQCCNKVLQHSLTSCSIAICFKIPLVKLIVCWQQSLLKNNWYNKVEYYIVIILGHTEMFYCLQCSPPWILSIFW